MSMGRLGIILASAVMMLSVGASGANAEFVCPLPQKGAPGVLPESEAKIKELSGLLSSGDLDNRIHLIITNLRRDFPKADDAAIVNYLVTAYCPVVDAESIGDDAKTEKVNGFSSEVLRIIASQSSGG
jgi:hypothetical protein